LRGYILIITLGMAVVTYITRATFLVLGKAVSFPPLLARSIRYVPVAVLAAIVFPAVLAPGNGLDISFSNPYLVAALCTVVVFRLTRNSVAGIVAGLGLMMALRLFT